MKLGRTEQRPHGDNLGDGCGDLEVDGDELANCPSHLNVFHISGDASAHPCTSGRHPRDREKSAARKLTNHRRWGVHSFAWLRSVRIGRAGGEERWSGGYTPWACVLRMTSDH